jgi:hypothetical protein
VAKDDLVSGRQSTVPAELLIGRLHGGKFAWAGRGIIDDTASDYSGSTITALTELLNTGRTFSDPTLTKYVCHTSTIPLATTVDEQFLLKDDSNTVEVTIPLCISQGTMRHWTIGAVRSTVCSLIVEVHLGQKFCALTVLVEG